MWKPLLTITTFQLSSQNKAHKHWVPKPIYVFLDDHFKYSHEFPIQLKFSNCIFLQRFCIHMAG